MEISNDLLSKMLSGDSSTKVAILKWHVKNNIIALGNNHTSELSRLTVEYQRKGKTFKKSFILKVPSAHPMYDLGIKFKVYEREYPIYSQVLEEMYKIDGEHIGPKLYYTDDKYSLILKDLSLSGYRIVDRVQQLDFNQCTLVLKGLAKFHALSVKLNQASKIPSAVKTISWLADIEMLNDTNEFFDTVSEQLAYSIDPEFGLYEKIMQIRDGMHRKVGREIDPKRFRFNVLNHGDCWLGNTLFKFDKYGNVMKVKLIDYQCTVWLTPAYDILIFTLSSMRFDVFEKHFDFLMETYIETLNNILRFFQCDTYSLQDLYCDMDSLPVTICYILCYQLPQTLSTHENPMDYHDYFKDGVFDFDSYKKIFKNPIYLRVLNQWISHYVNKGLFD